MEEAEENNDLAKKDRIKAEMETYEEDLNLAGKSKKFRDDDYKRIIDKIARAIKRAIKKIEKYDKNLADHFRKSLPKKLYTRVVPK